MSNRKLQMVLNHPSFAQVLGRTRLHTYLFARPLSRSSCLKSVSLLPKTGLKPEEYHSARNLVDRGSAASSKTTPERRLLRTLALGTAPRPVKRMPKSGRKSLNPLTLDPHKRNLGTFGLCVPSLTRHAGKDKWRWSSKCTVIVSGTATQCRIDCYWPATERLAPFQFYLCLGSTNGHQALHMMEVWDGEPDISRQYWPLRQLMRNKELRPFLQMAEDEGLLEGPGTTLRTLKYKDVINKHATFYPFTVHYSLWRGQKRAFLRLKPNIFDPYLQSNGPSYIVLWDPTITGVSFFQYGDMNEDGAPARVVWLAPAVIRRSSNSIHAPKEEFRVCLFEKTKLEPVHVRDRTGRLALWAMPYTRLRKLVQPTDQSGAANTPRASLLARMFMHGSLWHDAVLDWDAEAQEQFDRCMISERDSRGSPQCRTCGGYGHSSRVCASKYSKPSKCVAESGFELHTASIAADSLAGGASAAAPP